MEQIIKYSKNMTNQDNTNISSIPLINIILIWIIMLVASDLPDVLLKQIKNSIPDWLIIAKLSLLLFFIVATLFKEKSRFRILSIQLLILTAGRKMIVFLGLTPDYVQNGGHTGLLYRLVLFEGPRILLSVMMITILLLWGKPWKNLFLAKGELNKWKVPGIIIAVSIMFLTFAFFSNHVPVTNTFTGFIIIVPAVLIFAGLAALDEELRYRTTLLAPLLEIAGKKHSILLTAVYFGLSHYFKGVPSGIMGLIVAGTLGWLYAKIMIETRGVLMSWFNHFLTNVPTYLFWAIS
jgi:hypothetical protein